MNLRAQVISAAFLFVALLSPSIAVADPVTLSTATSPRLIATGGDVSIYFAGSDATFNSLLFLHSPGPQGPFFPSQSTPIGEFVDLGNFSSGVEMVFRLHVLDTGDDFFTGPAGSNADGVVHAQLAVWSGSPGIPPGVLAGFEDLFGGGDLDFNDFQFVATNVRLEDAAPVPEPATVLLVGAGAALLCRGARKRRTREQAPGGTAPGSIA
jgi:hypothetical protein